MDEDKKAHTNAISRKSYNKNKEKQRARAQKYRDENQKKIQDYRRKRYAREKEKEAVYAKQRLMNNPLKNISTNQKYRDYHYQRMIEMKEYMGGKCDNCSHNILRHLEFCHYDPQTKNYNVSAMQHKDDQTFCEETGKCHLLCKNCHYDETRLQQKEGKIINKRLNK